MPYVRCCWCCTYTAFENLFVLEDEFFPFALLFCFGVPSFSRMMWIVIIFTKPTTDEDCILYIATAETKWQTKDFVESALKLLSSVLHEPLSTCVLSAFAVCKCVEVFHVCFYCEFNVCVML